MMRIELHFYVVTNVLRPRRVVAWGGPVPRVGETVHMDDGDLPEGHPREGCNGTVRGVIYFHDHIRVVVRD